MVGGSGRVRNIGCFNPKPWKTTKTICSNVSSLRGAGWEDGCLITFLGANGQQGGAGGPAQEGWDKLECSGISVSVCRCFWPWGPAECNSAAPLHPSRLCQIPVSPSLPRAWGFPADSLVKNLPVSAGDSGLIPGSGRSPGEGNGSPLQYSCWRIPWTEEPGGVVHGFAKSWAWLSS